MTTENEDIKGAWERDVVETNVKLVERSLKGIKEKKEDELSRHIDSLATKIKESGDFFYETKSSRTTFLQQILSSSGIGDEQVKHAIERIDTLALLPSPDSVNALFLTMQRLRENHRNKVSSENSGNQNQAPNSTSQQGHPPDGSHNIHSRDARPQVTLGSQVSGDSAPPSADNQDSATRPKPTQADTDNPTQDKIRKRQGSNGQLGVQEQRGSKRPRATCSRGRGKKRAQTVHAYSEPARKTGEQARSYGARTLFLDNICSKEFVFKFSDKFWVLRCDTKSCQSWTVEENPFEESRAVNHFKRHSDNVHTQSEEYVFNNYAYEGTHISPPPNPLLLATSTDVRSISLGCRREMGPAQSQGQKLPL